MKILLLGEFSGFYNNLFEGLRELGHEVDLIANQDGWKRINVGKNNIFSHSTNRILRKAHSLVLQSVNIDKLKNYDVIQIVSPNIFGLLEIGYNQKVLNKIITNNEKAFLSVAGDHYYIFEAMKRLKYKIKYDEKKINNKAYKKNNDYILELIDGIIPISFNYAEAYRNHSKLLNTIPLPINLNSIKYYRSERGSEKIRIFHGLNREDAKGTEFIKEAMYKLEENYSDRVEVIIDGKMPFDDYLKVLQNTDIVIDQALSYGYGMNAIYSMALGKVVLGGNEIETQSEFGRSDIPVINITPSVEDIYQKLEVLVQNPNTIDEIGMKSRLFVEDFHSHTKVAQRYIDTWKSIEVREWEAKI